MRLKVLKAGLRLMVLAAAMFGLQAPATTAKRHAPEAAVAAKFRWTGECNLRCTDGRCVSVCLTGAVFAVDAFDAKLKAEAEFRARTSSQGTVIEGTVRVTVVLDLFEARGLAGGTEPGSTGRVVHLAAATTTTQGGFPGTFRYRFEAYRNGNLVASTNYQTYAENPSQLGSLMLAAQAGWSQQLRAQRIDWDRIVNVGPL
jgi:hypothetical protein